MGQVFRLDYQPMKADKAEGLNPRLVGQVFRQEKKMNKLMEYSLNPRLVGQVFRPTQPQHPISFLRLNPRLVGQVFRLGLVVYK